MSIINIHTTTSTNDALKLLVKNQTLDNYTTISTSFQTNGRGVASNLWESEEGKNLLFSTLIKYKHWKAKEAFKLNQVVSLAIVDVLSTYVKSVVIKWPNDILADSKKVSGILIENTVRQALIPHSIIGVGLNVNQLDFGDLNKRATSLAKLTGKEHDREDILKAIISRFQFYFDTNLDFNYQDAYLEKLYGYQENKTYQTKEGRIFEAKIINVEQTGLLVLEDTKGQKQAFDFKAISLVNF